MELAWIERSQDGTVLARFGATTYWLPRSFLSRSTPLDCTLSSAKRTSMRRCPEAWLWSLMLIPT